MLGLIMTAANLNHIAQRIRQAPFHAARMLGRVFVPPSCLGCGVLLDAAALCPSCWKELRLISKPFCPKYAVPFAYEAAPGTLSPEALAHPAPWTQARAAALFDGLGARLVHGLKYSDRHDFAPLMARMMAQAAGDLLAETDIIAPVPLHWRRHVKRRYNQAGLLATHVARCAGKSAALHLLRREQPTQSQVGLSREGRKRNVSAAFGMHGASKVKDKTVLLVDDVMTSGATLAAATRALQKAGARQVNVLVFARVTDMIEG